MSAVCGLAFLPVRLAPPVLRKQGDYREHQRTTQLRCIGTSQNFRLVSAGGGGGGGGGGG
ncbi:hypothetical protein E4U49_008052 [Claviceps purpurea]|nr:hypothetical protein E4U49_008052 [Claviceps purpurea]